MCARRNWSILNHAIAVLVLYAWLEGLAGGFMSDYRGNEGSGEDQVTMLVHATCFVEWTQGCTEFVSGRWW